MWERIAVILRKEFIQTLREPRMRILLFVPPIVQLLVFGFAVNLDVDHTTIAWMDMDRSPLSRELRARFDGSGRFEVVGEPASETDVQRGRPVEVQVLVDGTNSNTASLVSAYAGTVVANFSSAILADRQNARLL